MPLIYTLVFLLAIVHGQISDYTDELFFKVNDEDFEHVSGVLRKEDYTFVSQVLYFALYFLCVSNDCCKSVSIMRLSSRFSLTYFFQGKYCQTVSYKLYENIRTYRV